MNISFGGEEGISIARAEIYIDVGEKTRNKMAFDLLFDDREAIEREFGETLNWTRRDDIRASRIYVRRPGSLDDVDEVMEQHRDWFVDRAFRLKEVFGPRIRRLTLPPASGDVTPSGEPENGE